MICECGPCPPWGTAFAAHMPGSRRAPSISSLFESAGWESIHYVGVVCRLREHKFGPKRVAKHVQMTDVDSSDTPFPAAMCRAMFQSDSKSLYGHNRDAAHHSLQAAAPEVGALAPDGRGSSPTRLCGGPLGCSVVGTEHRQAPTAFRASETVKALRPTWVGLLAGCRGPLSWAFANLRVGAVGALDPTATSAGPHGDGGADGGGRGAVSGSHSF